MLEVFYDLLNFEIFHIEDENGKTVFLFTIKKLVFVVTTVFLTFQINKKLKSLLSKRLQKDHSEEEDTRYKSLFQITKYIMIFIMIVVCLRILEIKVTSLIVGSGVFLAALGFGLRSIFLDFYSGILILVDRTLKINDIVEVEGLVGRVKSISLRATTVDTRDERIVIIPNHKFITENLYNWTQQSRTTRFSIPVRVSYKSDPKEVKKILIDVTLKHPYVLKEPEPMVMFSDFEEYYLKFEIFFYTKHPFYVPFIKSDIRYSIFETMKEKGIKMPIRRNEVHVLNQDEIY